MGKAIEQEDKRHWPKKEIYLGALALVATTALSVTAIAYRNELMNLTHMTGYSLLGVLIIAFIAGSMVSVLAIPVPYWILVFTLPSVLASQWGILSPVWVGVASALGATLSHIPTFLIGYGSSGLSRKVTARFNSRYHTRAMEWAQKHGSWAVFFMSAVLNPIHLPMTIAIGALRFPPRKWFIFSLLGNTVKSSFIAFSGYFGLNSLLHWIGM